LKEYPSSLVPGEKSCCRHESHAGSPGRLSILVAVAYEKRLSRRCTESLHKLYQHSRLWLAAATRDSIFFVRTWLTGCARIVGAEYPGIRPYFSGSISHEGLCLGIGNESPSHAPLIRRNGDSAPAILEIRNLLTNARKQVLLFWGVCRTPIEIPDERAIFIEDDQPSFSGPA
jgi:hypothetical protein